MTRNGAFDRFRGIGALCVVFLHAPPLYHSSVEPIRIAGWVLRSLCQSAVPFFFILSGWMLAARWRKGRTSANDLLPGLGRLLLLYCPWFALYLALDLSSGLPTSWDVVARRFASFSDSTLDTRGYHLWFLPSLMLAQLAIWASLAWARSIRPALLCGIGLYAAMAVLDALGIPLPWGLAPHEGVNLSLVCVAAGAWLVLSGNADRPIPWGLPVLLGTLALLLETFAWDRSTSADWSVHAFPVFRVVLPVLLLLFLNGNAHFLERGLPGRLLDLAGRNASAIYVAHIAVLTLVPFDALVPNGFVRDNLVRWAVAFTLPILLGETMRRSPWRWVRAAFQ